VNPGVVEEGGQTLRAIIGALSSQPFAIAMILSNFLLLAFIWYMQTENNKAWEHFNASRIDAGKVILQYAENTNALLAKCVVPQQ
jgi:hypothetical protein